MRYNRFKALRGNILEANKHLNLFVKNLYCPTKSIPYEDLSCLCFQVIAGQVFSAALWPLLEFRANQLNPSYITQVSNDLSYAKIHSLSFGNIRNYTNSLPLDPTMILEKHTDMTPPF